MNFDALVRIRDNKALDKAEKAVLNALAVRENEVTKQINPSISTLCSDTGFGRSMVTTAIRSLKDQGMIQVDHSGYRGSSHYTLIVEQMLHVEPSAMPPYGLVGENSESPKFPPTSPYGGLTSPHSGTTMPPHNTTSPPCGHKVKSEVKKEGKKEEEKVRSRATDKLSGRRDHDDDVVLNLSRSRSRKQPGRNAQEIDLVGKVELLLNSSVELSERLFFDEPGRAKAIQIFNAVAQRERAGAREPTGKQLEAINKIAVRWRADRECDVLRRRRNWKK